MPSRMRRGTLYPAAVTSREERLLLINLAELMASNLDDQTDDDLVAGVRDAEAAADRAVEWSGQLLAVLKSRKSWAELVQLTGMPQTTMYQRVNPRRPKPSDTYPTEIHNDDRDTREPCE